MKVQEYRQLAESSRLEESLWAWLKHVQPGHWQREFPFHPKREWRLDFAREDCKLAIEVDGLLWSGKGGCRLALISLFRYAHQRGKGYQKDCEKMAEAMVLGWRVLRVTSGMIRNGAVYAYIEKLTLRPGQERG